MSDTQQLFIRLQRQIEQLHSNQKIYAQKLQEINESRLKLADQIDHLQLDYQKKYKQIETKMNKLINENQTLLRQNQIYLQQIQNFQARLLEKQKLISMLINQQNQKIPICDKSQSIEDSKSEYQEEQKQKQFKKIHNTSKAKIVQENNDKNILTSPSSFLPTLNVENKKQSKQIHQNKKKQSKKINPPIPPKRTFNKINNPTTQKNNVIITANQPQQVNQKVQTFQPQKNTQEEDQINFFTNLGKGRIQQKQQQNNFLKHFQKQQEKQFRPTQFFNTLRQSQIQQLPITINSDIQQSSIDYHDSSIISSSANVFNQVNQMTQPIKKMAKKKAKRDNIQVVNPDSFV